MHANEYGYDAKRQAKAAAQQEAWENQMTADAIARVTDLYPGAIVTTGVRWVVDLSAEDSHVRRVEVTKTDHDKRFLRVWHRDFKREARLRDQHPDLDWDGVVASGELTTLHHEYVTADRPSLDALNEAVEERVRAFIPDYASRRRVPAPWEVLDAETDEEARRIVEAKVERSDRF